MKQWAIIELFGHTTLAGFVQPDADFPTLIRLDVPETPSVPAWTKLIGPNAVYAMTPVSEETARLKAESLEAVPINVYDIRGHIKRSMDAEQKALPDQEMVDSEGELNDFDSFDPESELPFD